MIAGSADRTAPGEPIVMPAMLAAQVASWHALMDLHDLVRDQWTLVGGQMVHLHCAERDTDPERPTDDAVVDVRAGGYMLERFTRALLDLGFVPYTPGEGFQHRWIRNNGGVPAQIDVLRPDGIGERAAARHGAGGAPTLATPGGTQALSRSRSVLVTAEGRSGWVRRPNLLGALVMKAAAHTAVGDPARGRHRFDFAVLASLVAASDFRSEKMTRKDCRRLRAIIGATRADPAVMVGVRDAERSLARVERAAGLA